jgi:hypothetical protein
MDLFVTCSVYYTFYIWFLGRIISNEMQNVLISYVENIYILQLIIFCFTFNPSVSYFLTSGPIICSPFSSLLNKSIIRTRWRFQSSSITRPCRGLNSYWRFGGACCLHPQPLNSPKSFHHECVGSKIYRRDFIFQETLRTSNLAAFRHEWCDPCNQSQRCTCGISRQTCDVSGK